MSELFIARKDRYIAIHQRLQGEEDVETRGYLRQEAKQLENAIEF